MKKIAVYGAGGFGKEIRGMIDAMPDRYIFAGFIDDFIEDIKRADVFDDVVLAIADPKIRQMLVAKIAAQNWNFPPLLASDVTLHPTTKIGKGSIITSGVKTTVDICIGDFVIINLNTTIGHDCVIGNFSSLMPSVSLSGNVKIGEGTFIGSGAIILQGITIGSNVVIGAGTVVTKPVEDNSVVVGIPGRVIKKR